VRAFPRNPQAPKAKRQIVRLEPVYQTTYEVFCIMCGDWFTARRSDAKWCSTRCRSRAWRRRQADRRPLEKMVRTEPLFEDPLYDLAYDSNLSESENYTQWAADK